MPWEYFRNFRLVRCEKCTVERNASTFLFSREYDQFSNPFEQNLYLVLGKLPDLHLHTLSYNGYEESNTSPSGVNYIS